MLLLALGNVYVAEKNVCYLAFRCDLCIYGRSRGQREVLVLGTSRSLAIHFSPWFLL